VSGIFEPKIIKSDNWFSSYSQKCQGCFFETQCSYGAFDGLRAIPTP